MKVTLSGTDDCINVGKRLAIYLEDRRIRFQEYQAETIKNYHRTYVVKTWEFEPETGPSYKTGRDNSGRAYEQLEWTAIKGESRELFHLQTWDREVVYPWCLWWHQRFGYQGEDEHLGAECAIIRLSPASQRKLVKLLEEDKK